MKRYLNSMGIKNRRFMMALTLSILVLAAIIVWLPWIGTWLAMSPSPQPVDAIVVLGSDSSRYAHGIELYRQGFAPELWITGDETMPVGAISFAQQMAREIEKVGVPRTAIHVLATTSTWEDGREIAALAQARHIHRILVVTSWYHNRRALCVIRQHLGDSGVDVYYDPPLDSAYGPTQWWRSGDRRGVVFSELVKLGGYAVRYGLNLGRCL